MKKTIAQWVEQVCKLTNYPIFRAVADEVTLPTIQFTELNLFWYVPILNGLNLQIYVKCIQVNDFG